MGPRAKFSAIPTDMMRFPRFFHSYSHYFTYYSRIFLLALILIGVYYGFLRTATDFSKHPHFVYLQQLRASQKSSECVIPLVDPWDPSILTYYSKASPLECSPIQSQAVKSFESGILTFDPEIIKNAKCYKISVSHDENVTDLDVKYGEPVLLNLTGTSSVHVDDEMFEVTCETNNLLSTPIFKYHYAQIVPRKDGKNIRDKTIEPSSADFPSVIMIGLDSMSRSNFIRQMPKTYKHLMDSGFIDMKGHMKIHDNTYGNILAILTGLRGVSVQEFKAEINESWHMAFDEFPFVWKDFNENGYATMFAEDRPDIGTFTYKNLLLGFLSQPTDHYLRPFWISSFWSLVSRRSAASCYDAKPQHRLQLEYLDKFLEKYENKRKFAFWWSQDMSHGFLNLIGRTDDDFEEFFKRNEKRLADSIVVVLSDHGHRYDKIRETVIGRIESRMPFHAIRIPDGVRKKYPWIVENLEANSKLMTTQFDVNDSLRKVAKGQIGQKWTQTDRKRSYSYFDPFPKRTSCLEAGIPSDFCPCFSEIEIPSEEAKEAAGHLLGIVNGLLENTEQTEEYQVDSKELKEYMCTPIEVDKIEYSSVRLPMMSVVNDVKSVDTPLQSFSLQYHVVIRAKPPSSALIESTLEHNLKTDSWSSLGEIERNNKYGNTSFCVNDRILKKICHCISRKTDPNDIISSNVAEQPGPACSEAVPSEPGPSWPATLSEIFFQCSYPLWSRFQGLPHQMLLNWPFMAYVCDEEDELAAIPLYPYPTRNKVYWGVVPQCNVTHTLVTLGIQSEDSLAVRKMKETWNNLVVYGTGAFGSSSKDYDHFYNYTIGANGTGVEAVYGKDGYIKKRKSRPVRSFFKNVLGLKLIDMLWINVEGGETEYWRYFSERGVFDRLGIIICQFNIEINKDDGIHFEKFLIDIYTRRHFIFLRPTFTPTDQITRAFFLNIKDEICVRKYLK
ncbi:unnamed protein product [Caenorhabditis sp. 36 PRJEB53466]|nr:unnamed protein product [Caenorhabditis sp. 36 PRJEB53466]